MHQRQGAETVRRKKRIATEVTERTEEREMNGAARGKRLCILCDLCVSNLRRSDRPESLRYPYRTR